MTTKKKSTLNFKSVVSHIQNADQQLSKSALMAVNACVTTRNWLIGMYIQEYEQKGSDRAKYGQFILDYLSKELLKLKVSRVEVRELRRYRQFYQVYPQIRETVSPEFKKQLLLLSTSQKRETLSPELQNPGKRLVNTLSFSHFNELLRCEDDLKRTFYEIECIRGVWSVRELRRQIDSLYYERSGLSNDRKKLAKMVCSKVEIAEPRQVIRDPYVFEFMGLKSKDVMDESQLELQLLDQLQDFLLELGHGFCFEARQRRILIGSKLFYVDLVFYHRILKCHVLVELKIDDFSHEYIGQLNTYVSWYRDHQMSKGDNSPIGILLCTEKDHTLVEYALAGLNEKLFVSKYQVELPKKELMRKMVEKSFKELQT